MPDDDRPLWKLSRDETRMLLITVVGGFASVLLSAAAIGIAVALARNEPKDAVFGVLGYLTALEAIGCAGLATKQLRLLSRALFGRLFALWIGFLGVNGAIVALGWLGIAAGLQQQ
jgi:hypothetical protein